MGCWGEQRWIVGWGSEGRRGDERRAEEREVSGRAGAPRGPRRSLYISGLPSPLTRQAVSATFSRSVASASCQRKQRARFVKPKVKLRSNEGTVPPRRHLRHHPATGSEGGGGDAAWMWNVEAEPIQYERQKFAEIEAASQAPKAPGWQECHVSDKRRRDSDVQMWLHTFDLRLADRFRCHFRKSKAGADLKAHLRNKSSGAAEILLWRISGDRRDFFFLFFFCCEEPRSAAAS